MQDMGLARKVQDLLASKQITISTTTDVIGIELVGALKNVLAIAMGIVKGADMGENSLAALLTYVSACCPVTLTCEMEPIICEKMCWSENPTLSLLPLTLPIQRLYSGGS